MNLTSMRVVLFTAFVFVFAPSLVSAQTCAPGRVVSETSAGHCCWPAQSWSDANARCEGVPSCPAGFGGDGASCVAIASEAVPHGAPSAYEHSTAMQPSEMRFEQVPNLSVTLGGAALFLANYAGSIAAGFLYTGGCGYGNIGFLVPMGSFAALDCGSAWFPELLGAVFGLGQVFGIFLMVAGTSIFRNTALQSSALSWRSDGLAISF